MDKESASRYRAAELRFWREAGARPQERWIDLPRHDTTVRVLEVGEGEPILFIHGVTTAGSMWAPLAGRMPRHRCIVLDRPGCGLSHRLPPDRVTSFPVLLDLIVAVLDSLDVEEVDIVGSSFGGACALAVAEVMPQRVRRIVLEGSPAIAGIRPTLYIRLLAAGLLGRYLVRRRISSRDVSWSFGQWGEGKLAASGRPSPMLDWARSLANDTETQRNEVLVVQSIASWRGFRAEQLLAPERLRQVDRPALWLWGSNDPIATVDQGREWAASMPDAEFEVLDAGHVPWLDDPDWHAARIGAFLEQGAPYHRAAA